MNIQGISIIATYGCNASCGHCFFGSSTAIEYLDPDLLSNSLSSLSEPLSWLHFTGGEPLLRPGKLFELLNAVEPYHDGSIGLATNGFWGGSSA
ncbi:MAG: 4Fe-4S cluster-binding domain-containing protein, partial [Spirochaetales bacterium]|nr:4Fe-4S cluster-binding domain-containing protein [Spirochaetales bacterium]